MINYRLKFREFYNFVGFSELKKQNCNNDFKILYPDYEQLKNLDYLERKLVRLVARFYSLLSKIPQVLYYQKKHDSY